MSVLQSSQPVIAGVPAEHGFIALTPDPTKYHPAGGRTMLPRAKGTYTNHQSRGFHHEQKGMVYMDPQDPTTGYGAAAAVDFSQLSEAQVRAAVSEGSDPADVMQRMQEFQRTGQHKSATAAAPNTSQMTSAAAAMHLAAPRATPQPMVIPATGPTEVFVPSVYVEPTQSIPMTQPTPVQPDPTDWQKLAQSLLAGMTASKLEPAPSQAPPPVPTEKTYTEAQIRAAFQLSYLSMEWQPPTVMATFITQAGTFRALYHDIVRRDRRITLIVDTRQDSPLLFIPAVTGETDPPIRLRVDSLGLDELVLNLDYHAQFGTFDHYDLLVESPEAEEQIDV